MLNQVKKYIVQPVDGVASYDNKLYSYVLQLQDVENLEETIETNIQISKTNFEASLSEDFTITLEWYIEKLVWQEIEKLYRWGYR